MNIQLKAKLEQAINNCIENNVEENYWEGYIYPTLSIEMANAAEAVFDASMSGQEFAKSETQK